jgi:hypothetical protein
MHNFQINFDGKSKTILKNPENIFFKCDEMFHFYFGAVQSRHIM